MAGEESDQRAYLLIDIGFRTSLLIIYSVFITRIALQLHRKKKRVNAFINSTLILIGLSIVFLQVQTVAIIFFPDEIYDSTVLFLYNDLSYGFEQAGICVDIVRLRLILVTQDKDYKRKKRNAFIIFIIAIFIIILFQCLIGSFLIDSAFFLKYLQEDYPQNDPEKVYLKIVLTLELVQTYLASLGIIFSYIGIFIIYRRRVQTITEQFKDDEVREDLVSVEKSNKKQLIFFCVSICQLYLYRIIRDTIYFFEEIDERNDAQVYIYNFIFSVLKILFIFGILMSLEKQIQNAQAYINPAMVKDSTVMTKTDGNETQNKLLLFPDSVETFGNEDQLKMNNFYAQELASHPHDQLNESFILQSSRALSKVTERSIFSQYTSRKQTSE